MMCSKDRGTHDKNVGARKHSGLGNMPLALLILWFRKAFENPCLNLSCVFKKTHLYAKHLSLCSDAKLWSSCTDVDREGASKLISMKQIWADAKPTDTQGGLSDPYLEHLLKRGRFFVHCAVLWCTPNMDGAVFKGKKYRGCSLCPTQP